MSRNVQVVLLCEDQDHATFARRYLVSNGWQPRSIRILLSPAGCGSAEQFVRTQFKTELAAYRSNRSRVSQSLVVVLDGDSIGMEARVRSLDQECRDSGIEPRMEGDRVAVFVPTWNIETWFSYLDGQDVVESRSDYPRLDRPRECERHVRALSEMCVKGELRQPAPPSLVSACREFKDRLAQDRG